MALRKQIVYKEVVCEYHKIVQIDSYFYTPTPNSEDYTKMDVGVALYKDVAARNGNVENILRIKQYHFYKSDLNSPASEKIDKVYKALKKLPEYDGAEDV